MTEARIIDGKAFAATIRAEVAARVAVLRKRHGIVPGLAVIRVGEDPASEIYVRNKDRQAKEAGIDSHQHQLPSDAEPGDFLGLLAALNGDPAVNAIMVQLPLPQGIDAAPILDAIDPKKDVDGFHAVNLGRLVTGGEGMVSCTPLGIMMLLKETLGRLEGSDAVMVGRSNIVGKPAAMLLLREDCTVTIAHSWTHNLAALCRRADILIAAVGRPQMIRGDWVKPGATVIDVGVNRLAGPNGKARIVGDVAFDEAVKIAGAITPVPGGVGPMTIACLLQNTVKAACRQHGITALSLDDLAPDQQSLADARGG